jgi:membrane associated rhomboid family serine protease
MRLLNMKLNRDGSRERKAVSKERNSQEAPGIKAADNTIMMKQQKEAPGNKAKDDGANEATKKTPPSPKSPNSSFNSRFGKTRNPKSESREPGSSHSRRVASSHSGIVADSHTPDTTHSRSAHARIARLKAGGSPESAHSRGRSKPRASPSPRSGSKHERLLDDEDVSPRRSRPTSQSRAKSTHKKLPMSFDCVVSEESMLTDEDAPPQRSMSRSAKSNPKKSSVPLEYMPPSISDDSTDKLTKADKYHTALASAESSSLMKDQYGMERRLPSIVPRTFQPPAMQTALKVGQEELKTNVSAMTDESFGGAATSDYRALKPPSKTRIKPPSKTRLKPPSQTRRSRRDIESVASGDSRYFGHEDSTYSDDDYHYGDKQKTAYACMVLSAVQLGILVIQMLLCGVASVDINPMIGPYPDAFSEWGGKNAYLMLEGEQYFRIITPVLLHVGLLHLLVNAFVQLETCAYFEKEWGSGELIILYLISGVGSVATCCVTSPDIISVSSSGALMGLFGAKFAQVLGWTCFDVHSDKYDAIHLDQLGGVMCSTALISILGCFTYIDWAGHMGGLGAGFLGGMLLFCKPIENTCVRILWGGTGLLGLVGGAAALGYLMEFELNPDEDLADACSYFRSLYPEGYDCECAWN